MDDEPGERGEQAPDFSDQLVVRIERFNSRLGVENPDPAVLECYDDGRVRCLPPSELTEDQPSFTLLTIDEALVQEWADRLYESDFGDRTGRSGATTSHASVSVFLDHRDVSRAVSWDRGAEPPAAISEVIASLASLADDGSADDGSVGPADDDGDIDRERVLLAVDGTTDDSSDALRFAEQNASETVVLYVVDEGSLQDVPADSSGAALDALESQGESITRDVAQEARSRGLAVERVVLRGDPRDAVLSYARNNQIDWVRQAGSMRLPCPACGESRTSERYGLGRRTGDDGPEFVCLSCLQGGQ